MIGDTIRVDKNHILEKTCNFLGVSIGVITQKIGPQLVEGQDLVFLSLAY